ncbi:MAG: hypothetical protein U0521_16240 [Anaerolineae bacterium]
MTMGGKQSGCSAIQPLTMRSAVLSASLMGVPPFETGLNQIGLGLSAR